MTRRLFDPIDYANRLIHKTGQYAVFTRQRERLVYKSKSKRAAMTRAESLAIRNHRNYDVYSPNGRPVGFAFWDAEGLHVW